MVWRSGQAYSDDLRGRVLSADGSARAIAARFGVSVAYVVKARQRRDHHGEVSARAQTSRTPRRLAGLHDAIADHVRAHDEATLDELRAWLREVHGMSVSMGLMWNTLARLGLTLKKRRSGRPSRRVQTLPPLATPGGFCN
ncbi:MAG TPA: hypothetical protein VE485_03375, partial [Mycobacterium sp.]|nr:hypothetical protein [Mycobacterium sp.]